MENANQKKGKIKRLLWQILGWFCLIVGLPGLFLPFLQGIFLILVGIILLSATYPKLKIWIERKFEKGRERHRKISPFLEKTEKVYRRLVEYFEVKN